MWLLWPLLRIFVSRSKENIPPTSFPLGPFLYLLGKKPVRMGKEQGKHERFSVSVLYSEPPQWHWHFAFLPRMKNLKQLQWRSCDPETAHHSLSFSPGWNSQSEDRWYQQDSVCSSVKFGGFCEPGVRLVIKKPLFYWSCDSVN